MGKKGLQHVFGSYALKVVIDSPIPVVVVQKRSFKEGYGNIVFPIGSDVDPRQEVQWVKLMAKLFNSTVHLFQAVERDAALSSKISIITRQITDVFVW